MTPKYDSLCPKREPEFPYLITALDDVIKENENTFMIEFTCSLFILEFP